ncbi:MAG: arylesterase [Clostridia bacterium]
MPLAARTLFVLMLVLASCLRPLDAAAAGKSILVFGDSLSAAYGIPQGRGWVALLGERLKRERRDYSVANASVSGETTAGGKGRFAKIISEKKPSIVILELGANDGLRGLPVAEMKKNLAAMIVQAQKAGARVVLVGMRMPPNYGPDYAAAFDGAFAELAGRYRTALVPFLLEGFAEKQELFQPDHIHPIAEAQPLIVDNVWKGLAPLLGPSVSGR